MPYTYEYMNKITQFGVINYTLKLTDSDGVLEDVFMPVILSESEDNDAVLDSIANGMIASCNPNIQDIPVDIPVDLIQDQSEIITDNV